MPWRVVPQRDDGTVDVLRDVAPVSEAPQHSTGVNEAGGRGDATGGAVCTDDDIGDESTAIVELDGRAAHCGHPPRDRFGTGGDGDVAHPRVKAQPGDGSAVVGIRASGAMMRVGFLLKRGKP